jgi:Fic family protein
MKANIFTKSSPGRLVKNLQGNSAFVPNSLPVKLNWTDELVGAVARAEAELGRLAGLGHRFPEPQRLVRLFLRREAELSSRIEDTHAGVRTQLLLDALPEVRDRAPGVDEVNNNFKALEFGLKSLENREVSQNLIKEMHALLLQNVRGHDMTPGKYRTVQAHIGRSHNIKQARFVPPPPYMVPDCMDAFERFIHTDSATQRVARLAMMHYQFECIHPFADGNGRIGRVLILLLMSQWKMLPLPLFNPSAFLEQNRREYYDHLMNVSVRGDWNDWIIFFANGIVDECLATIERIESLEKLRMTYQARVRTKNSPANVSKLVDELFAQPRVTLEEVRQLFDMWPASAQRYIDRLVKLKILREVTGRERNRVYLATEVVDLFSDSTAV